MAETVTTQGASTDLIQLVLEPPGELPPSIPRNPSAVSKREFEKIDRLATALSEHTAARIKVVEDAAISEGLDGFLLVWPSSFEHFAKLPQSVLNRIIVFGLQRGLEIETLEALRVAGGVENHEYFMWRTGAQPNGGRGGGLYVRRSFAEAIGARCAPRPWASDQYCLIYESRFDSLPALIVGYLESIQR